MIFKSTLFRLSQILSGTFALYLMLMAATFAMQEQFVAAQKYGLVALAGWIFWAFMTFIIRRRDIELVREVALIVYPGSALVALFAGVVLGLRLENMVRDPQRQSWTLILAGVLIAIVMIVRCLDIRWLRNAEDLHALKRGGAEATDKYGELH